MTLADDTAPEEPLAVGGGLRRTTAIYAVVLGAQAVVPLLATPLLTRLLGPLAYGDIVLFVVAVQMMSVVANLGIPTALPRIFFRTTTGPAEARGLLLPVYVISAVFVMVVLGGITLAWSAVAGLPMMIVPALAAGVWLLVVFEVNVAFVRCAGHAGWFAGLVVLQVLGSYGLGLAAVAVGWGAQGFIVGWLVGVASSSLLSLIPGRPRVLGASWANSYLPGALRLGVPAAFYALTVTSLIYVDRFVLGAYHGAAAVGEYQVVYTVGASVVAVVGAVNLAWGPEVLSHLRQGWRFLQSTTDALLALTVVLGGVVLSFSPEIVVLLAPASFDRLGIATAAAVLVPLGALQLLQFSRVHALTWIGDLRVLASAAGVVAGLQLILNIALDGRYPLAGPAMSSLITMSALVVILVAVTRRKAPEARMTLTMVASTGILIGLSFVSAVLINGGAPLAIRLVILAVATVWAVLILGPARVRLARSA